MFRKYPFFLFAIIAALPLARPIHAQNPDDVFHECTRSIAKLTNRCQNAIADKVDDCVPVIKRLLNAGHRDRARRVAEACIKDINEITRKCQAELKDRCERCAHVLVRLGAPNLAREILDRCRRASNRMSEMRDRAVAAIRGLF